MTAALSREVAQARRAMDESCMGTDEYEQAKAWHDRAVETLCKALSARSIDIRRWGLECKEGSVAD